MEISRFCENETPTSHFQAETLKAMKADGDEAGPGGNCSPSHESGSLPVPLPRTQITKKL